jgi:hypothetical protein
MRIPIDRKFIIIGGNYQRKRPGDTEAPPGVLTHFRQGLELAGDGLERRAEVGADGAHHGHRSDGNQRRDQTVLDRRCAVFVLQKLQDGRKHLVPPRGLTTRSSAQRLSKALSAPGIVQHSPKRRNY